MIKITLANGNVVEWKQRQYTDYKYDGSCFIIIDNDQWVGFYNMAHVISVVVDGNMK